MRSGRAFKSTGKNEKEKVDGFRFMSRGSSRATVGELQALSREHRKCSCAFASKLGLTDAAVRADLVAWLVAGRSMTPLAHAVASSDLKVHHGMRHR